VQSSGSGSISPPCMARHAHHPAGVARSSASGPRAANATSVGLAQILGQLQASNKDLWSKCWANLHNLGQPCEFRVAGPAPHASTRSAGYPTPRRPRPSQTSCALRVGGRGQPTLTRLRERYFRCGGGWVVVRYLGIAACAAGAQTVRHRVPSARWMPPPPQRSMPGGRIPCSATA
jgi:hypothetical protein